MRYVISGYLGLVGSSLKKRLDNLGHECVYAVDLRSGTDIRHMNESHSADIFFHLGAFCKINESIKDPSLPFEHNVVGTQKVLDYCVKNKIPKIVFTSSTRVLYPNKNPYVASKIFCEELIKGYTECYGIDHSIVRLSTVYHGFDDKTGRLIDIWMRAVLNDEPLKIYGDENKTLDFSYTDDVVDGLLLASKEKNSIYDIASGESHLLGDVASEIIAMHYRYTGKTGKIIYSKPELAQPQEVQVDISKIKDLGYKPKVGIMEGLNRTYLFYKKLCAKT